MHLAGRAIVVGALLGAVGVDEQLPAVALTLEAGEADRAGGVEEHLVVALERLLRPRGALAQHRGDVGPIDLAGRPRLLDCGQVAERPAMPQALPRHADRDALLPRQPRGARSWRPSGRHSPRRVPHRQHPRLRDVERAAQLLQAHHRGGEVLAGERVQIDAMASPCERVGGRVEQRARRTGAARAGAGIDPPSGQRIDTPKRGGMRGVQLSGTSNPGPEGMASIVSNWCYAVASPHAGSFCLWPVRCLRSSHESPLPGEGAAS